jgi:hypothetical protein
VVLNFRQPEEESLSTSWDHFNELIITSPDLAIQDPVLLQYFYMGLSKDSRKSLNAASRGAFLHLSASEARAMLFRTSEKTPCTSIHNELLEKERESSSKQEEGVLIVKSQPLQSQGLAINPEPPIPQNTPREGISLLEIPVEDLFGADFGRTLNSHLHKRHLSEYNSNSLKKRPLRKCPYSHIGR